jgi:hypothetical protein
MHEEENKCIYIFIEKSEGNRPFRISRSRGENNIKMNIRDVGFEGVNWIRLLRMGTSGELL